uniref:Uncharacterized protein n=1 Tax=Macaca fascicularis TaxID=9541 RepID=Q9GMM3_MACFA|nr:hypothetical protein [Macaca fascicularis]
MLNLHSAFWEKSFFILLKILHLFNEISWPCRNVFCMSFFITLSFSIVNFALLPPP